MSGERPAYWPATAGWRVKRVHLLPKQDRRDAPKRTPLCQINNRHFVRRLDGHEPGTLDELRERYGRRLCANCGDLVEREEPR